jgi:hypothetical protein
MSTMRFLGALALGLLFAGCAHQQTSPSSQAPPQPKAWPHFLSEEETARFKQVAWDAAASPGLEKRSTLLSIPSEPVKLSERGMQFYLDQTHFDNVEVAIPSGRRVGWHACYIGVTIARGTYEVVRMRESFWP